MVQLSAIIACQAVTEYRVMTGAALNIGVTPVEIKEKAVAKETWQLAGWLTHAVNASRHDGTIVVDATHSVIEAFGAALIRQERQTPERCVKCGSLRLVPLYKPESDVDGAACLSCGWEFRPDEESSNSEEEA
jgi:hypothetical protein